MKDIVDLVKYAINHRVIVITNYYKTTISKISYLIITDTEILFQSTNTGQTT